jgi:D-glycero-D-manno-heptose 1,7-bisphosphate phosphatase
MKIVILDRDGVINQDSDAFIKSPEEWQAIPGSLEAIGRLNHAGYRVVVATNQSGIARGLFDMQALNAIHHKMHNELGRYGAHLDAIFFCPHGPEDACRCRKPAPGLFEEIARRFHCHCEGAPAIGDSLRDIQAAHAIGAQPILVRTGKGALTLAQDPELADRIPVYGDLAEAVDALLDWR